MKKTDSDQHDVVVTAFAEACKAAGLKLTHQRMEIYRELFEAVDHPSAETLYRRLTNRLPTLSLDTVYRTLATFEELSFVQRVPTRDGQARFEVMVGHHHHFICLKCKKIIDFQWQEFDQSSLPPDVLHCGAVESKNIILKGFCRACLDSKKGME